MTFRPERRVIYTVNINDYDKIRRFRKFRGWDFVYFSDRKFSVFERMWLGKKCQIRVFDTRGHSPGIASRLPKILPHVYLPEYDYSVYVDAAKIMRLDVAKLCDKLNWPLMAASLNPFRTNAFEEIDKCISRKRADIIKLTKQKNDYLINEKEIMTQELTNNSVLLRAHNHPHVIKLSELWWKQLLQYTHRDQASLAYVCHHLNFNLTKFSVAEWKRYFLKRVHKKSLV